MKSSYVQRLYRFRKQLRRFFFGRLRTRGKHAWKVNRIQRGRRALARVRGRLVSACIPKSMRKEVTRVDADRGAYRMRKSVVFLGSMGVLAACGLIGAYAAFFSYSSNPRGVEQTQRRAFAESVHRADLGSAAGAIEQLVENFPDNQEYRFQQALIAQQRGRLAEATSEMELLAQQAHPPAASWLVEREPVATELAAWSETERERYLRLLELALSNSDPARRLAAHYAQSKYLLAAGETEAAVSSLTRLVSLQPAAGLDAAFICLQMKDETRSREFAGQAAEHFAAALFDNPLDVDVRLKLARAQLLLANEPAALKIVSEGNLPSQPDPRLQQAGAEALTLWANRLLREQGGEATLVQRIQLLHRATQCAPHDAAVNEGLLKLLLECARGGQLYSDLLQRQLVAGSDPESLHFMIGLLALLQGDASNANSHLQLAMAAGSQVAIVLNNLAIKLLAYQEIDPSRALALVDYALQQLPQHPYLCETRGRVLTHLDRFDEAIPALLNGLAAPELEPIIYPNLALAYRCTGDEFAASCVEFMAGL